MPNWCEGTLKVRGTKENVKKFLLGGLQPLGKGLFGEIPVEKQVEEDEYSLDISAEHGFHVKGSRRNFIESSIEFYYQDDERDDERENICVIEGYRAAWAIDVRALVELSKLYEVDLKIYAFERGMEFNQDIEIHKGEIVKNDEIQFSNYDWECINPTLGG